jgi:hypothetical protein
MALLSRSLFEMLFVSKCLPTGGKKGKKGSSILL